jgi:hypothetical protein
MPARKKGATRHCTNASKESRADLSERGLEIDRRNFRQQAFHVAQRRPTLWFSIDRTRWRLPDVNLVENHQFNYSLCLFKHDQGQGPVFAVKPSNLTLLLPEWNAIFQEVENDGFD